MWGKPCTRTLSLELYRHVHVPRSISSWVSSSCLEQCKRLPHIFSSLHLHSTWFPHTLLLVFLQLRLYMTLFPSLLREYISLCIQEEVVQSVTCFWSESIQVLLPSVCPSKKSSSSSFLEFCPVLSLPWLPVSNKYLSFTSTQPNLSPISADHPCLTTTLNSWRFYLQSPTEGVSWSLCQVNSHSDLVSSSLLFPTSRLQTTAACLLVSSTTSLQHKHTSPVTHHLKITKLSTSTSSSLIPSTIYFEIVFDLLLFIWAFAPALRDVHSCSQTLLTQPSRTRNIISCGKKTIYSSKQSLPLRDYLPVERTLYPLPVPGALSLIFTHRRITSCI